jgi:NDP-sugar pyrophosphorylase family protein
MNGDLLTTLDFRQMLQFHDEQDADFTVGMFPREVKIDFGVIKLDGTGCFNGYDEKPTYHFEVSMGVNVISRRVLEHLEYAQPLDMPALVLKVHQTGGRVACYRQPCRWLDIGRMDDYAEAQEEFAHNEAAFLNSSECGA